MKMQGSVLVAKPTTMNTGTNKSTGLKKEVIQSILAFGLSFAVLEAYKYVTKSVL